jgi:hypothetical protein
MQTRGIARAKPVERPSERGLAIIAVLITVLVVTVISVALVGLMNTDITHAGIQHAVTRSFYIAQAGLEEAKLQVARAADPAGFRTSPEGVTVPYGGGQFTYWVEAGPATGCGAGLTTLEVVGRVAALRIFSAEVRACAVPGAPLLAALFGVARVEFQGAASRTYLAPYAPGTPGGGGSLGSFSEIRFTDNDVRLNALSEESSDTVTVREGTVNDYGLFGFATRPSYNPNPVADPTPWILGVFGDLITAQLTTGAVPSRCGTPYGCVTVGNQITGIDRIADLRQAKYEHRVYLNRIRRQALPRLTLDPAPFRKQAERNTTNAALNQLVGLPNKGNAVYTRSEFNRIMFYLSMHPAQALHGTVFVDDSLRVFRNANLGGAAGDVTLAVAGDLIIFPGRTITNRHDLATVPGRRTPGIVVLGAPTPAPIAGQVCGQPVNGSGRMVVCAGGTLVVDGLVYTQDGMVVQLQASVDQVGAMYHNNRGTLNPSFLNQNATVVLRFDPLTLSAFGQGLAILSWQRVH